MKIELIKGDITQLEIDCIVNAANTSLLGGGGVDGAIHKKGGKEILEECVKIRNRQGGCKVGEAVITTGGKLPVKKVIHTVGPRWNKGDSNEAEKLSNCYKNSLSLAEENDLTAIAFPNISTGIYGYPKEAAAAIAIEVAQNFVAIILEKVVFVCYDDENYKLYQSILEQ